MDDLIVQRWSASRGVVALELGTEDGATVADLTARVSATGVELTGAGGDESATREWFAANHNEVCWLARVPSGGVVPAWDGVGRLVEQATGGVQ